MYFCYAGGHMDFNKGCYEVIIGAFSIEYNAEFAAGQAAKRGIAVTVNDSNGRYRVSAGQYCNEEKARERLQAVQSAGYVFSYIMPCC